MQWGMSFASEGLRLISDSTVQYIGLFSQSVDLSQFVPDYFFCGIKCEYITKKE